MTFSGPPHRGVQALPYLIVPYEEGEWEHGAKPSPAGQPHALESEGTSFSTPLKGCFLQPCNLTSITWYVI